MSFWRKVLSSLLISSDTIDQSMDLNHLHNGNHYVRCFWQEAGSDSLQKTHAMTSHMRSVLQSVQPSNHTSHAKAARQQHQLPSVMVKQSDNPQTSSSTSMQNSQPQQHKAASRGPHQPSLSVPNIQRKRNAQGQLRNENDLQAAPGMTPGGTSLPAHENFHSFHIPCKHCSVS